MSDGSLDEILVCLAVMDGGILSYDSSRRHSKERRRECALFDKSRGIYIVLIYADIFH